MRNLFLTLEASYKDSIYYEFISSKSELLEGFLIEAKKSKDYSKKSNYEYYSIRGNCGVAAIDFIMYAEKINGGKFKRIYGFFKCDKFLSEKSDFTKEMKSELLKSGFDINKKSDRDMFLASNKEYSTKWKYCPHYWCVDSTGTIYDPSGMMQFVQTGLAKDLSSNRYSV